MSKFKLLPKHGKGSGCKGGKKHSNPNRIDIQSLIRKRCSRN